MAKKIDPKIRALMQAGVRPVPPVATTQPTTATTDVLGMPVPTEEELVPTKGKLKTKAGSNNRKMIIALIVLGAVVLIVGAYLIISAAGLHGAVKAANTFSNQ